MTPVEQVHALWSAFASGGALAALEHVDEDCEWLPAPDVPGGETVRGPVEMRAQLERLEAEGVRVEPSLHSCEAVGDHVVAGGRMRIASPAMLADSPYFWLYVMRGGRVVRVESHASQRDALDAARAS